MRNTETEQHQITIDAEELLPALHTLTKTIEALLPVINSLVDAPEGGTNLSGLVVAEGVNAVAGGTGDRLRLVLRPGPVLLDFLSATGQGEVKK